MSAHTHLLQEQIDELLGFFQFAHLPPHLQAVSAQFRALVKSQMAIVHGRGDDVPLSWELVEGLRHLVKAKDCFVRAALVGTQGASEKSDGG
jgi:hypothetical protein